MYIFILDMTVANPKRGTFFKPKAAGSQGVPEGKKLRRWRAGTQALREIRNYMRTTNLCIRRAPFLWLVILWYVVTVVTVYSTVHFK